MVYYLQKLKVYFNCSLKDIVEIEKGFRRNLVVSRDIPLSDAEYDPSKSKIILKVHTQDSQNNQVWTNMYPQNLCMVGSLISITLFYQPQCSIL